MTTNEALIQPEDQLLSELHEPKAHRNWTLLTLINDYPWESQARYDEFMRSVNERKLTPENHLQIRETMKQASEHRTTAAGQTVSQEKNDVLDALLEATGLHTQHEA